MSKSTLINKSMTAALAAQKAERAQYIRNLTTEELMNEAAKSTDPLVKALLELLDNVWSN